MSNEVARRADGLRHDRTVPVVNCASADTLLDKYPAWIVGAFQKRIMAECAPIAAGECDEDKGEGEAQAEAMKLRRHRVRGLAERRRSKPIMQKCVTSDDPP